MTEHCDVLDLHQLLKGVMLRWSAFFRTFFFFLEHVSRGPEPHNHIPSLLESFVWCFVFVCCERSVHFPSDFSKVTKYERLRVIL